MGGILGMSFRYVARLLWRVVFVSLVSVVTAAIAQEDRIEIAPEAQPEEPVADAQQATSLTTTNATQAPEYTVAEPADWVQEVTLPTVAQEDIDAAAASLSNGMYYLVVGSQAKVAGSATEKYRRYAWQFLDQTSVADNSDISIDFNPEYQQLTLHYIRVHRGGQIIDKLIPDNITLLRRESDLERRMYDGRWTARIVLENAQPGDVLDYAFTIKGRNPVLGDHYVSGFDTGWAVPVELVNHIVHMPNGKTLYSRHFEPDAAANTSTNAASDNTKPIDPQTVEPVVSPSPTLAGHTQYQWQLQAVEPTLSDSDLPSWYFPWPWVQVSEYDSWGSVVDWARPLYVVNDELSPELQAKLAEFKKYPSQKQQITQAIRWVQDDIRYLGLEIGEGSYRPSQPNVVAKRGFGDCKDKTLLLVTLLREFGIKAYPALVNTRAGRNLPKQLPSSGSFDHVIVMALIDGVRVWIDPTFSNRGGDVLTAAPPSYDNALIIADVATLPSALPLVKMPVPMEFGNGMFIHEHYTSKDFDQPAQLTVTTTYRGADADGIRARLAASSINRMTKTFLQIYSYYYPDMRNTDVIQVNDNKEKNEVVITENYVIRDFWQPDDDDDNKMLASFYPSEISSKTQLPSTRVRTMPLYIGSRPVHFRQLITANLPERKWNFPTESSGYVSDAFTYKSYIEYADGQLSMDYMLKRTARDLTAEQAKAHIKKLKKIRKDLGYNIFSYLVVPEPKVEAEEPMADKDAETDTDSEESLEEQIEKIKTLIEKRRVQETELEQPEPI